MGDADPAREHARLQRFFVAPSAVADGRVALDPEQQSQLRRVLRLGEGDTVIAVPDDGSEILITLHADGRALWGEVRERWVGAPEPRCSVWLYQSALRGDRFTWLLQKGTEIGVSGFAPVLFRHTQQGDYNARGDRYRAVVLEAAEQCRRARLPAVLPAQHFAEALHSTAHGTPATRLLLDEQERALPLREALTAASGTVHLFVGPEGGLTEGERALARASGLCPVSLGRRILRSETAGLVAATLVLGTTGDLG